MKVDVMKLPALRWGQSPRLRGVTWQGLRSLRNTEHPTQITRATRASFQVGIITPQHSTQRINLHK